MSQITAYNPKEDRHYARSVKLCNLREETAQIIKQLSSMYIVPESRLMDEAIYDLREKYIQGKGKHRSLHDVLREMFARGYNAAKIGRETGYTAAHVGRLLRRAGIIGAAGAKMKARKK